MNNLETDDVMETVVVPEANGVDDTEKWAKLVERFNKLKSVAFYGKGDLTLAQRWKDSMKKVFSILRVGAVDQQSLAVFNLTGSAWEWWKSASTEAEQNTVTWTKFERRFNIIFIPKTSMIAKSYELEKLE